MTLPSGKKPLPERIDKTLEWLETSRDGWKSKSKIAKDELKKRTLAVKRARESRDEYKEQLEQSEKARHIHQDELKQKTIELATVGRDWTNW